MMRQAAVRIGAALLVAGALLPVSVAAQSDGRILVMPFENARREGRIFWLGEAASVLVADELNARGADAISTRERRQAFERLQVPPAATLTDATVIRIGQLVGAGVVVVGSLQMEGETLVVRARAIALESGKVQADATERGPLSDLFPLFERLSHRLDLPAQGPVGKPSQRPPVSVFENYIKGLLADTPETAVKYLNAALAVQPSYDRARLALWDVYTEEGEHARALVAAQAVQSGSMLRPRAQFLAGLSQLSLKRHDEAFTTFKALADQQPTAAAWNNIGVVQLRRGSTPQTGLATYYFTKAVDADPDDPDYAFNLGYAYWETKDTTGAIYWLREAVRRRQSDGDAHYVLGAALAASGSAADAVREKELARRLSSTYEQWEKRPAADVVPKGLERVKGDVELPHARRIETALASSEQRDQQELARFYLDRARRLYQQENDRAAAVELSRALYLSPYLAEAHLLDGRIHLRNGRAREAVDAFKISLWSADTAEGHAALGEAYRQVHNAEAARAEADRALALDPQLAEARRLLDMLKSP